MVTAIPHSVRRVSKTIRAQSKNEIGAAAVSPYSDWAISNAASGMGQLIDCGTPVAGKLVSETRFPLLASSQLSRYLPIWNWMDSCAGRFADDRPDRLCPDSQGNNQSKRDWAAELTLPSQSVRLAYEHAPLPDASRPTRDSVGQANQVGSPCSRPSG